MSWEIHEGPLGSRLEFPNTSLEIAETPSWWFNHPMRRAVLSTFLFVAILGLGCMGVAVPGKADELKHPIVLQPKCQEYFDKYLDKVQQHADFYYSSFAYVSGSLGYSCAWGGDDERAIEK